MGQERERKYILTKVGKGDYLLPSNDGCTLWRLRTYEDGPSHGLDWPRDLTFWGVWRWDRPMNTDAGPGSLDTVDPDEWDRWEHVEGGCETRAEAIDAALRLKGVFVTAWKAHEIHEPRKGLSVSKAKRLEEDREKKEIRETHRRLKVEYEARERRRRAA